jgi:hypothetical protein
MDLWQQFIVIAAGVLTLINIGDKVLSWVKELKQPQNNLELRIMKLEKTVDYEYKGLLEQYEIRFSNDLKRLDKMDESNKLTQRALLALTRHAESGNNIEELKDVSTELNKYVWGK